MARSIESLVEEQVARWKLQRGSGESSPAERLASPNVVTLSNAIGSEGLIIADRVGEKLGIPVYGREIVEHIAVTKRLRIRTVETLDERAVGHLEDYLTALFREQNFDQSDYVRSLTRTIAALCEHGPCVLIGRGGAHIVSHDHALRVRVTAPLEQRIAVHARREGLSEKEAARQVNRIDAERRSFIQRFFGAEIDAPLHYDLVLVASRSSVEVCTTTLVETYRARFGDPSPS